MIYSVNNTDELKNVFAALNENDEIILSEGVFEIDFTMEITKSNVRISGQGEKTVIKGSKRVELSGDGKQKIDLAKEGITQIGEFAEGPFADYWWVHQAPKPCDTENGPSMQLYWNGEKMVNSIYPREGCIYIKEALGSIDETLPHADQRAKVEGIFIPEDLTPFDDDINNILLKGWWHHDWASQYHLVDSFDAETGVVTVKEPWHTFGYSCGVNVFSKERLGRFFVINSKHGFEKEGDWYIDRTNKIVSLIPFKGQRYVDITTCQNVFRATGVNNITVENLVITEAQKCGIFFEGCNNVTVDNVDVTNVGAWGIIVNDGDNNTVSSCNIYRTGGGGISVSGGDRNTLREANTIVKGCSISEVSWWHRESAIRVTGVGVTLRENHVFNLQSGGISYHGNKHILEHNEVDHVSLGSNDSGAIYAGMDISTRGNIIRYNYIHDLSGRMGGGSVGVYFDDGMCSAETYGNVFANIKYAAIQLGGGRNHVIHHNVFYNCEYTMTIDMRIETWLKTRIFDVVKKRLDEVPYESKIWKETYPEVSEWLSDEPTMPKYNSFTDNVIIGGNGIFAEKEVIYDYLEVDRNTYIESDYKIPTRDFLDHFTQCTKYSK